MKPPPRPDVPELPLDRVIRRAEERRRHHPGRFLIALVLVGLVAWVFYDSHLNIPVVSPLVCSIKGGVWHDGGVLVEPGCYAKSSGP